MVKFLFVGPMEGKNYFVSQNAKCNFVVFWERIPEKQASGASPYKVGEFYEKAPEHVTVVHHDNNDEFQHWKNWMRIYAMVKPKVEFPKPAFVEPRFVVAETKTEQRSTPEMIAKIKCLQKNADIVRKYEALLDEHRIAWSTTEKQWLLWNRKYVPNHLKDRLFVALGLKQTDNKQCPFIK